MNILVVGPGAMGCLFAARLKIAGCSVALFDHNTERADLLNSRGIMVEGVTGEYSANLPVVSGELPFQPDFTLICVKSTKTEEAARSVRQWISHQSMMVTLQNGVGNLEILKDLFGRDMVLGGVTAEGATVLDWGKIRHAGQGATVIGPCKTPEAPAEKLAAVFRQAGFDAKADDNIDNLIWGKLVVNVGINALTAITGLKNGRLPQIKGTGIIMEEAVKEAVRVAEAKEIELPFPDPLARVIEVCHATSGNIASMLQDVLNKRTTEVDFINGAIVREGLALNIPTPVNLTLTSLVKILQETYEERLTHSSHA